MIETARLRLEPITPGDADKLVPVLADPSLYRFIGGQPPSVEVLRTQFERWSVGHSADGSEEWRNWLIRDAEAGQAVGTMQATIADGGRAAWIAWLIAVPWQGRGLATEAAGGVVAWLRKRGVKTLRADIHPDNAASEGVARRIGLIPTDRTVDGERVWEIDTDHHESRPR